MCGISLILDPGGSPETRELLLRMHEPIRHRGPDGEGFLLVDREGRWTRAGGAKAPPAPFPASLGIAFRRLRIIDLSEAASQPMASPDGSIWIAFNGEIYNFRELRKELAARGRTFRSSGDTEVALAAFEAWGEDCFRRFEGMWAIAIADLPRRRLVVARDRFGIKPLYWAVEGKRLLLASEIKQILGARRGRPHGHAPLLAMYLRGVRLPCLEETFFEGIRSVPPATWFEVPLEGPVGPPEFRTYWDLSGFCCPAPDRPRRAYPEALEEFRSLMADAVTSHDVADVTVGSLLSGGLDSSTVTSLLLARSRSEGRACPTFSFGIPDAELCELGYVDAMVRRYGLLNHRAGFDRSWILESAPRAIRAMEEPPLALAALAQYRVFQLCREHGTTVVLDGQGADEILAGYPYYERTLLLDRLRKGRLGDFAREFRAIGRRHRRDALSLLGDFLLPPLARRLRRGHGWLRPDYGVRKDPRELATALGERGRDPSLVNRQLYYDVRWGNVKIVLGYSDKNAMAHSVEARVPFFDRRLVEFAFSLPDSYKVGGGQRKRILRDVARDLVPPEITERPDRMGFAVPDEQVMRDVWPFVRGTIADGDFVSSPCFEARALARFVEDFEAGGHDDARALWRLYALALWREEFGALIA